MVLVFSLAMTSMGFSLKPTARNTGVISSSKPNTLPKMVPKIIDEMPHGNRILPIAIFLSFHISSPTIDKHRPCPRSANMTPKIRI